jgi:hypothetical protein
MQLTISGECWTVELRGPSRTDCHSGTIPIRRQGWWNRLVRHVQNTAAHINTDPVVRPAHSNIGCNQLVRDAKSAVGHFAADSVCNARHRC